MFRNLGPHHHAFLKGHEGLVGGVLMADIGGGGFVHWGSLAPFLQASPVLCLSDGSMEGT